MVYINLACCSTYGACALDVFPYFQTADGEPTEIFRLPRQSPVRRVRAARTPVNKERAPDLRNPGPSLLQHGGSSSPSGYLALPEESWARHRIH